ncbi:MAG: M43 family zinc metalloprotease [Cyclobacteriaceae bacterium]
MRYYLIIFIIFSSGLLHSYRSVAQRKCATEERHEYLSQFLPLESEKTFENWLQKRSAVPPQRFRTFGSKEENYVVPVVVHVIHNGEAVGVGSNISDAQVQSQIDVLNEDFQRMNDDTIFTRDIFKPVAADVGIEFQLAKRTPENLPTNGIVRIFSPVESWSVFTDEYELKALSYWPAEDYLNIWVVKDLKNNFVAYATYPISDLPGVDDPNFNRLIDGIVVGHKYFGSVDKGDFSGLDDVLNKGRTVTHEIGHYFGLRHTWGDGGCNVDDYCDDTPNTGSATFDCPLTKEACDGVTPAMIENFMDYTDDSCMNLFTQCQKSRMLTVLFNSPRRLSLLSSLGAEPPDQLPYDLSLNAVYKPNKIFTGESVSPIIEVVNVGKNPVNTFKLILNINEQVFNLEINDADLASEQAKIFSLPGIDLISGQNSLELEIVEVEGFTDDNFLNNQKFFKFLANTNKDFIPALKTFNEDLGQWGTLNEDDRRTWEIIEAPSGNPTASMELFNYRNSGTTDWLVSPALDFTFVPEAAMSFRYAYGGVSSSTDGLAVLLYTHGGDTLQEVLFERFGSALNTVSEFTSRRAFQPDSLGAFEEVNIDLSKYAGQPDIRIAFLASNGNGNNIFIDDIEFFAESNPFSLQVPENIFVRAFPNPSYDKNFNLTFNLEQRQQVNLLVVDAFGHTLFDSSLGLLLNQTVPFSLPVMRKGVYFFKFTGTSFNQSIRVMVL